MSVQSDYIKRLKEEIKEREKKIEKIRKEICERQMKLGQLYNWSSD